MKRIKFYYSILLLILLVADLRAQTPLTKQQKLDSLKAKFTTDSTNMNRKRKFSLLAGFDTRNSFVSAEKKISVKLQGVKAGVKINGCHNLAIGYYSVINLPKKQITDENGVVYDLQLNMSYGTLFYEYVLLNTKRWEIGIPVEIGGGNYHTTATDTAGKKYKPFADTARTGISLFGAGLDVSFKIFQWLGFNATGGYRLVGGAEPQGMNFNGVFYSVGFEIYFGRLYKMAKFGLKRRTYRNNVKKINQLPD